MPDWNTVQQLIRIIMQIVAGALVSSGIITATMATTLVGSAVSLIGLAWWAYWMHTHPGQVPPVQPAA